MLIHHGQRIPSKASCFGEFHFFQCLALCPAILFLFEKKSSKYSRLLISSKHGFDFSTSIQEPNIRSDFLPLFF